MGGFDRRGPRWASVVVMWLLLCAIARATFQTDFSLYPAGARACLKDAADESDCGGDDVTTMNRCLCSNSGDFIFNTAECVGVIDSDDLSAVYSTMTAACDYTNTPIEMTESDFMEVGYEAQDRTVVPTTTEETTAKTKTTIKTSVHSTTPTMTKPTTTTLTTTTSAVDGHGVTGTTTMSADDGTPTQNHGDGDGGGGGGGGLSGWRRTAVIVGASVGSVALLAAAAVLILCYRRRHLRASSDEKHPMLSDAVPASYPSLTNTELSHLSSPPVGSGGDPCPSDVGMWTATPYVSAVNLPASGLHAHASPLAEMPATVYPPFAGAPTSPSPSPSPWGSLQGWPSTAYR